MGREGIEEARIKCGVRESCGRKEECGVLREEGGLMLMKVGFCEVLGAGVGDGGGR
jgi:hypothetical protein